jgi:hypothetical protein
MWFKAGSYRVSPIQWQHAYVYTQICLCGFLVIPSFECFDLRITQHKNEALDHKLFVS